MSTTFESYPEWHNAITVRCGITLTKDYCQTRIAALKDPSEPSTKAFIDTYGTQYRDTVVSWFEQAALKQG